MKYSGQGPLAKKSNGVLGNKSGLFMSPFNVGPCVNPGEPNPPPKLPICGVAQITKTSKPGTQNGVSGTFVNEASITHKAIDATKPSVPSAPITTPGTETPPKSKPPSKNQCGKDVAWSDPKCKAYAKHKGGTVVDGIYIPGKKTEPTTTETKPKPAETKRTYSDVSDNKTTFIADTPKQETLSFSVLGGSKNNKVSIGGKIPEIDLSLGTGSGGGGGCPSGRNCRGATNKAK